MASWPKHCPFCDKVIDSHDSEADSQAELREHIRTKHGDRLDSLDRTCQRKV